MASYVVKSGDTLSTIAQRNGLTLTQLLSLNPQFASNPNLIRPGQAVNLSGGTQNQTQNQTGAKTQADVDAAYVSAVTAHPAFAGNTPESISYATTTGDLSGLMNGQGKPFSSADQQAAVTKATAELEPFYTAERNKDVADTESTLGQKKAGYEDFLFSEANKFQTDKTTQDQTAADKGVLFSGGRAEKLKQLQTTYERNNASKLSSVGADIGNSARDLGYKYGDSVVSPLSSYFNLGKNTYNANVATGGVGSGGLSNIYNANQGFQGTQTNTAKAEAQKRAALSLANKGNKLVGTGYTNQF